MGFGFNLFFVFVLVPLTCILLLVWIFTRKKIAKEVLKVIWIVVIGLVILSSIIRVLVAKKNLTKEDYHGQYIVNRDYFPGRQTDWQYNNFRFEIKSNDSIYFYITDKEKILKTFRGTISTVKPFKSERLVINMEQPTHHIMQSNATTYRSSWSFYLVFYSSKFNNVYFKKGQWKPLDK